MWLTIRRLFLGVLLIVLASAVLLLTDNTRRKPEAQQLPRVAILQHASQSIIDEGVQGMLDALAVAGLVDGATVSIQRFNAENDMATANAIAKEITGGGHDLILTATTLSLQAVANANRDRRIKHVFALVTDPAGAGVGISRDDPLQHPPYMAGYGTMQPVAEALQTARGIFPDLKVVGTVWNPAESNSEANIKLARRAGREMGIELLEAPVDNSAGVWEAANSLVARGVQALWLGGDVTVMTALDSMISAANQGKIPVFTNIPGSADRGALFDVGANYTEVGRLAGELAASVLQGEYPATIPVVNLVPKRTLINKKAVVGLKDPWRFPKQLLAAAEVVGEKKSGREQTPAETRGSSSRASSSPPATGKIAGKRAKTWNVQLLEYINVVDVEEAEQGIRAGLAEAGLVEGRDYRLQIQNAQGDMATLNMMVDAAVTDGADLIMTLSTPTLQAALARAGDIPIVFTFVADAVAAGAGRSNEDHLPNVTGVPSTSPYKALIDIAREVLPGVRRVGTLYVPAEANSVVNKERLTNAARESGIDVETIAVSAVSEMPDAAIALASRNIDAIVQVGSNLTSAAFVTIARAGKTAGIPVFGALSSDADNGAVVVIARDYIDAGREAGLMAARVMRGENPADIPFQPLLREKLIVNPEAARAVGIKIPPSVLRRASKVMTGQ